jgi:hypothetical protein
VNHLNQWQDCVKICVLENEIEARLLEAILKEQHIPHLLQSYYDTAYDGLYQSQKGWGDVRAPSSFASTIIGILSDLRKDAQQRENPLEKK